MNEELKSELKAVIVHTLDIDMSGGAKMTELLSKILPEFIKEDKYFTPEEFEAAIDELAADPASGITRVDYTWRPMNRAKAFICTVRD